MDLRVLELLLSRLDLGGEADRSATFRPRNTWNVQYRAQLDSPRDLIRRGIDPRFPGCHLAIMIRLELLHRVLNELDEVRRPGAEIAQAGAIPEHGAWSQSRKTGRGWSGREMVSHHVERERARPVGCKSIADRMEDSDPDRPGRRHLKRVELGSDQCQWIEERG